MEEVIKMLGPWPILQFMFGVGILGAGIWMIVRGVQKKDGHLQLEDKYAERRAYEHLENIEQNSFKVVELLQRIYERQDHLTDQLKALSAAIWNRRQGL